MDGGRAHRLSTLNADLRVRAIALQMIDVPLCIVFAGLELVEGNVQDPQDIVRLSRAQS